MGRILHVDHYVLAVNMAIPIVGSETVLPCQRGTSIYIVGGGDFAGVYVSKTHADQIRRNDDIQTHLDKAFVEYNEQLFNKVDPLLSLTPPLRGPVIG